MNLDKAFVKSAVAGFGVAAAASAEITALAVGPASEAQAQA